MTDYRQLCIELFGTDDVGALKKIAERKHPGRKKMLKDDKINRAIERQKKGMTTKAIAEELGVSRQTLSKYLNQAYEGYSLRLDFMHKQKVCTKVYVDYQKERVKIINVTNDVLYRAFGVNEHPTWQDYCDFLEERSFPSTRAFTKNILKKLDIQSGYDPLEIIKKTKGRMAEDNQYINITYLS